MKTSTTPTVAEDGAKFRLREFRKDCGVLWRSFSFFRSFMEYSSGH